VYQREPGLRVTLTPVLSAEEGRSGTSACTLPRETGGKGTPVIAVHMARPVMPHPVATESFLKMRCTADRMPCLSALDHASPSRIHRMSIR
jgi:hypothetical protein